MKAASKEAMKLMLNGAKALAQVEHNGIRIDTDYLRRALVGTEKQIKKQEEELKDDAVWTAWRKHYGTAANLGSREQLGYILYKKLGFECAAQTTGGGDKVDKTALEATGLPWAKLYIKNEELKKCRNTYLLGIERETDHLGFLHAFFNLHTTLTYRSSSDRPNFQNMPIRDPLMGKIIRRCFCARPGRRLVEIDYSAIEVRVAACYHKDKTMLKYIRDGYDMHRDMAIECYKLDPAAYQTDEQKKFLKACRQQAKALFVFAEFYGDYYVSCAKALWDAINRHSLKGADGASLLDHLKNHGVRTLGALDPRQKPRAGTFEAHIKEVEDRFWNERFPTYNKWRKDWFASYQERGYIDTLTGFHIEGIYSRNEVINFPVQGSAFHCLLWSLIRLQRECKARGLKALVVGQIHDSIVCDVPDDEMDLFLALAKEVMTEQLREAWPWIITPLEIEAEASPVEGNWHEKQPVNI